MTKPEKGERRASLEQRKTDLESELEIIQSQLGGSWDEIKRQIKARSNPKHWILKYPISSITTAFILGLWLGRDKTPKQPKIHSNGSTNSLRDLLTNEFKSIAVQRLTRYLVDQVENTLHEHSTRNQATDEDSEEG